jgi:hypothetical protein
MKSLTLSVIYVPTGPSGSGENDAFTGLFLKPGCGWELREKVSDIRP